MKKSSGERLNFFKKKQTCDSIDCLFGKYAYAFRNREESLINATVLKIWTHFESETN